MGKSQIHNRKVINKIVKAIDNTKNKLSEKAGETAQNIFESSVADFYGAYTPKPKRKSYYRERTYSLYQAISPTQKKQNGNKFTIRKRIHPGYIKGDPYRADKDWVFARSFYGGETADVLRNSIHGFTPDEAREWSADDYENRFGEPSKWTLPPSAAPDPSRELNLYREITYKWDDWKRNEAGKYMYDILLNELHRIN